MSRFRFMRALRTALVASGAAALALTPAGAAVAEETEDTENFSYDSWDLSYAISLDSAGRAQAEVTEELVAQFPDVDQNRGMVRALPTRYQGAPAAPENISVTDGAGNEVAFEVEDDDGFRSILIGDDSYVHGEQTYQISYTLDDVMHHTDQADEFYWDLVPADRNQDIASVSAEITFDSQLSAALTGSSACYVGTPDDTSACQIQSSGNGQEVFTIAEQSLPGGQALTAAIGVEPGTVTQPPERQASFLLDGVPLLLVGAAALLAAGGNLAIYRMARRHRQDRSDSPAAYDVPEGTNPLIAQHLAPATQNPLVPTILDLAVRGVIRIEEPQEQARWYQSSPTPTLHLVDPQLAADPLEVDLLEGLFPGLQPEAEYTFPKNDKTFTKTVQKVLRDSRQAVLDRGLLQRLRHRGAALAGLAALALLVPVVVLVIMGLSRDNLATTAISVTLGLVIAMMAVISMVKHRVHTAEGAAKRAQLMGVREMMRLSEGERLELMQSYSTAGRSPTSTDQPEAARVVEVYDQLLPYAVLFGRQKEWTKVLAGVYEEYKMPTPVWYPALLSSGAHGMEESLSSMLSSVSSAAGTASSGAGSTGGGAAGAGGGGGAAGGR